MILTEFITTALRINNLKLEGSQYLTDCPECGKKKHFYIDSNTGLSYCQVCNYKANPYVLVRKILSIGQAAAMQLIAQYGLASFKTFQPATKLPKFEDLRELTDDELARFCKVKKVLSKALLKLNPKYYKRNKQDCVVLPGYEPK